MTLRPEGGPKRPVLVTGATGFVGRQVVRRLVLRGHPVTALVRTGSLRVSQDILGMLRRDDPAAAQRLTICAGDVTRDTVFDALPSAEAWREDGGVIVHLAAAAHFDVDARTAERVNVVGTERVLALAEGMRSLQQVIVMSSAAIAGDATEPFRESMRDAGQHQPNHAAASKLEMEKRLAARGGALPLAIVRPSNIVGDSRTGETERGDGIYHLFHLLMRLAALPRPLRMVPIVPGGRTGYVDLVPIDYVADALVALVETGRTGTFHLVDEDAPTVADFLGLVGPMFGLRGPWLQVPGAAVGRMLLRPRWDGLRFFLDAVAGVPPELGRGVFSRGRRTAAAARALLEPVGIVRPTLPAFLPVIAEYCRTRMW